MLRHGVEDGRRTFANTLKYISITTSANFGNMISMALATLFLPFLPLLAKQILLNNFLSDMPSMAISTDNVDADADRAVAALERPRGRALHDRVRPGKLAVRSRDLCARAELFHADQATFQTAWFVVSLLTELVVVLVLRTRQPFYRSRPSTLLVWATVAVAALALALPFTGELADLFGFDPLPAPILAASVAIVIAYVTTTEALKLVFYQRLAKWL